MCVMLSCDNVGLQYMLTRRALRFDRPFFWRHNGSSLPSPFSLSLSLSAFNGLKPPPSPQHTHFSPPSHCLSPHPSAPRLALAQVRPGSSRSSTFPPPHPPPATAHRSSPACGQWSRSWSKTPLMPAQTRWKSASRTRACAPLWSATTAAASQRHVPPDGHQTDSRR